jgi:HTH-type transcriptional regulator, sugar sensing transcriptional regulator
MAAEDLARNGAQSSVINALMNLGFSQYEARTYVGLIGREPLTGYAIAKDTQVPQPKVYETLGRLVERGAVLRVSDTPAKFIAVAPARVLAQLELTRRQRIGTVELEISRLRPKADNLAPLRPYQEGTSWTELCNAARELINGSASKIYVSGYSAHLDALSEALRRADDRGVRVNVLCFGEPPFTLKNGAVLRHGSTDHMVYPHHQARHLALGCDDGLAVWALARDGENWEGIWSAGDPLLAALVNGFIRHDLFLQRIYQDFTDQIVGRYGLGLTGLFDWRQPGDRDRHEQPDLSQRPA